MKREIVMFIAFNVSLLLIVSVITYYLYNYVLSRKNKDSVTFKQYINRGEVPSLSTIFIGLIFGIVFGAIDNFGLWMGLDYIQKYIPGGVLTKSAVGNIYSNLMGVTIGTFISIIAKEFVDYNEDDQPLWVNSTGILIGCTLGMVIGYLITGKT